MAVLRQHLWHLSLIFVPIAVGLRVLAPERHLLIFVTSAIAILPLAAYITQATEDLAARFGGGIGGLLNATFGNATELIIGALALRRGLTDLVKASLTGSIIGNVLLVSAFPHSSAESGTASSASTERLRGWARRCSC
jgi:Ca2+:H+ antiporter